MRSAPPNHGDKSQRAGAIRPNKKYMSEQEPPTARPFVFTVIEDDGVNVTIEVSEENYQADLAAGIDEADTMKPGRYKMKRGGFLSGPPELKLGGKERARQFRSTLPGPRMSGAKTLTRQKG